ncbi:MAG: iron-containing redox enzyme family protein [Candidatus Nitrosopolaris sp.]
MTGVVERIDIEIEKQSLLKHPFYQMWSEGKLTADHLQGYIKEYFQLVITVPEFVRNIQGLTNDSSLETELAHHFEEESDHIEAWMRFAISMGVSRDKLLNHAPTRKTTEAVLALNSLTKLSFEEAAAAMYGYEKELPKISTSKINGLKKYYGIVNSDATNYFEIHEEADIRHARLWMNILKNVSTDDTESVFEAGVKSLSAQNKLLDSIQEKYVGQNC